LRRLEGSLKGEKGTGDWLCPFYLAMFKNPKSTGEGPPKSDQAGMGDSKLYRKMVEFIMMNLVQG
jgi:hypothetical protein